ncbi:diaminopimelate epimerase [Luteimonas fraxinea]|uniref:Diaminopimelate epimerase n=1 Tax=Luteimonas fraxinea TaxID=2901869 RepID=A0ABS8U9U6_9GAMM|nr:diaminopimelate epimerase [Luteimonas fraxinea]MCD9095524.1 diaminopimelate epimerase [Luteimonas fraxinea]MCD9126235.1 diaminopimelate epimerase [Luteimonas fraxinea]UHH11275.1 diaminopimelate epimerase [Luteimonas fraxinea]
MSGTVSPLRFTKMHGAGNDFVVLDLRGDVPPPDAALCRALADRHTGVGCDQILTVETPRATGVLARYRIWNADGSASQQCGNGARCVAAWLVRDGVGGDGFVLESPAGLHAVTREGAGYRIAMGVPEFVPARIPMAGVDTAQPLYTLPVDGIGTLAFGAASMGNPHAVIEVDDVASADVARIGRALQASAWFPESVNVGFAQVIADDRIRLRVFERGVGETLACGSGACAAVAVLARRGRTGRSVAVSLPGGTLHIDWPADDVTLSMSGPAAFVFEGEL